MERPSGRLGNRRAPDLLDQLQADRFREVVVITSRDHEGAGSADDVLFVVAAQVRVLVLDDQPVDRDAQGHGGVAHAGRLAAGVVRAVARQIDDLAPAVETVAVEHAHGRRQRRADRGLAEHRPRCGLDLRGEARGGRLVRDPPPAGDQGLLPQPGPLHQRHRDPAGAGCLDRPEHFRIAKGRGQTLHLEPVLALIDTARSVDREHQLELDRHRCLRRRRRGAKKAQRAHDPGAESRHGSTRPLVPLPDFASLARGVRAAGPGIL